MLKRLFSTWKEKAQALEVQVIALYYAYRHPRVPWYAKALSAVLVAYAFSPIDLIPDFIPVLGYLDDLVILPLGVAIVIKLISPEVMEECRAQARARLAEPDPRFPFMAGVVVIIWLAVIALVVWLIYSSIA
jgi:uncharacterized membrane protein YkvA (DUF1232 family)